MIALGTTTALGATGLALGTREAGAQADIELGEMVVEDATFSPSDGALHDVYALVPGDFEYRVHTDPADWQAFLLVGDGSGSTEAIALDDGPTDSREDSGEFTLRGPITATSYYDSEQFTVPDGGGETSITIPISVVFLVRDSAGQTLAEDRASDEGTIIVDDEGMPVAQMGVTVSFGAQDDETDPVPEV